MVAYFHVYTKDHWVACFKWVNYMVCKSALNKPVLKEDFVPPWNFCTPIQSGCLQIYTWNYLKLGQPIPWFGGTDPYLRLLGPFESLSNWPWVQGQSSTLVIAKATVPNHRSWTFRKTSPSPQSGFSERRPRLLIISSTFLAHCLFSFCVPILAKFPPSPAPP